VTPGRQRLFPGKAMDANSLLWIAQILVALLFFGFGYAHSIDFERTAARHRLGWMTAVGRDRMRVIGGLEILGAIGLILPAATGILPWLTPTAAAALSTLMLLSVIFHARRPGEFTVRIIGNVVLAVIPALIAYGRFFIAQL
jgi:hypothetical protein